VQQVVELAQQQVRRELLQLVVELALQLEQQVQVLMLLRYQR
jgi:hypothetical protein